MKRLSQRAAGLALAVSVAGAPTVGAQAKAGPTRSEADVNFMQGMIPHHAQAVLIAGWAASHGARDDVRILCERIVVGQKDEIALMRYWLKEKGEDVPAPDATHMKMKMNGMIHDMLMPGMLNEAQLAELDKARGSDFDRLFLTAMIAHHEGAIAMVDELLNSKNAAQDDIVYRMSSDVYADQTTEIERMTKMLATVPPAKTP
ncbi:MAG: DUF305 domain-containing protein [Gemmatimonadota bacterium]